MMTVYSNRTVSIDGREVGRIHKAHANGRPEGKPISFYTASGDPLVTGYDVEHVIHERLFIGGPSDWDVNPAFEMAVRKIVEA